MPFEDLYFGYQKIHSLVPKYFDQDWIAENDFYNRLNFQRNAVAEGYLQAYIEQLKEELTLLIDHRDKVLTKTQALLVNRPLHWIFGVLTYIEDPSQMLPEMETDLCPLTALLQGCKSIDPEEKQVLLDLHHTQHVMGNNFLFFINEQNYPLAVFLLSRFYGRTLDLSNRIGLSFQLSTIHELQKDALTGFYLRHDMETTIEMALFNAKDKNRSLSVLMLDLDHFKHVNDEYGHQSGDKVLRQTADLIRHVLRDSDKVFRYGGEEFLILFENADHEGSVHIAERLRSNIETHNFEILKGHKIKLTASIGVETFDGKAQKHLPKVKKFIAACDAKLYLAKENGRNRVEH